MKRIAFSLSWILIGATLAGCGPKTIKPPATAPVSGTVTIKGTPAAGVLVKFHPQFDIGPIKYTPLAETNVDGDFVLSTGDDGNGAPPGEYVVTFEKLRIESDLENSGIEMEVDEFEGRYSDPATSTWAVTIEKGDNELEPFHLE